VKPTLKQGANQRSILCTVGQYYMHQYPDLNQWTILHRGPKTNMYATAPHINNHRLLTQLKVHILK